MKIIEKYKIKIKKIHKEHGNTASYIENIHGPHVFARLICDEFVDNNIDGRFYMYIDKRFEGFIDNWLAKSIFKNSGITISEVGGRITMYDKKMLENYAAGAV